MRKLKFFDDVFLTKIFYKIIYKIMQKKKNIALTQMESGLAQMELATQISWHQPKEKLQSNKFLIKNKQNHRKILSKILIFYCHFLVQVKNKKCKLRLLLLEKN